MRKNLLIGWFLVVGLNAFTQMTGWSFIQPVTVKENTGTMLTNYQLRLTLDTQGPVAAGQMIATGDDIRFTSSCTGGISFPYWIESGMNTTATTIWVNIDTLHANESRTIYLQYGNAAGTAVSAIDGTFVGPNSATDSVNNGAPGGVGNSQRGFRFYPNEDILVTSFGKREPTGTTRYITLFHDSTQAILNQIQVSGPAGQYTYSDLSAPMWLTQGTQYLLEMYQEATDGYYFGSSSQIGQALTYVDMRYCNGCDQNTFPLNYLNAIHYGYPDLWYYTKNNATPAPTYVLGSYTLDLVDQLQICNNDSTQLALTINGGESPFAIAWTGNDLSDPAIQGPWASPNDTIQYLVLVSDACGYQVMDSVTVNVSQLPGATIQSNAGVICNGESADLSVAGDYDFLWNTGDTTGTITVMPSATTTYSVTVTDSNLCANSGSYTQIVNVPLLATYNVALCYQQTHTVGTHTYSLPGTYVDTLAGATSCDSIVTTNLTVAGPIDAQIQAVGFTLVADLGGDTYTWVDCNNGNTPIPGATGTTLDVTANGSYAVVVGVGNCTQISNCLSVSTIGLQELDLVDNISVYPNPNKGSFTVQSSLSQTVRISDPLGHVIESVAITAGQPQLIELKAVPAGLYFLASRTKTVRVSVE